MSVDWLELLRVIVCQREQKRRGLGERPLEGIIR